MSKARQANPTTKGTDMSQDAKKIDKKEKGDAGVELKKPANLRANATPTAGYVLSVDGKLKTQFETEPEATAAATKLKQTYPVIQVAVYDATKRAYTPIEPQE